MKQKITFFALISMLVLVFACNTKPTTDEALAYDDKIIHEQGAIQDSFNAFEETLLTYVPEEMEAALADALAQTEKSLKILKECEEFDKKTELRDAAIDFAEMYKDLAENEYVALVANYSLPDSLYSEEVEENCNLLLTSIDEKYTKVFDKMAKAQQDFADAYGFEINKKTEDIEE